MIKYLGLSVRVHFEDGNSSDGECQWKSVRKQKDQFCKSVYETEEDTTYNKISAGNLKTIKVFARMFCFKYVLIYDIGRTTSGICSAQSDLLNCTVFTEDVIHVFRGNFVRQASTNKMNTKAVKPLTLVRIDHRNCRTEPSAQVSPSKKMVVAGAVERITRT